MKMEYVLCHYQEIGLKGRNRRFFEEQLVENLKKSLRPVFFEFIKRISGRIIIKIKNQKSNIKEKNQKLKIIEKLKNTFGLAYFAFAIDVPQEIKAIKKGALQLLKGKSFKTFRISTKRSKKDFPFTSQEINEKIGEVISKKLKKKVDLENPDITCFIEIVDPPPLFVEKGSVQRATRKVVGGAFLYTEKIKGLGGLPVGVSGKAVSLLSGGIDSPVAAFYAIKRGLKIIFLHFHAYPYTSQASIEKAKKIVSLLNKFQFSSKLYLVPFGQLQKEILLKTPAKLRVVLYRRFMLRISEIIAEKEKAKALVTGESLGQVASQTLENIRAIEEVTNLPVFRPLIGFDKEEIIRKAKEIGTFEISILPHQDCCARFLPAHPETKAKLKEIKIAERKLNIEKLVKEAIKNTTLEKI